MKYKDILCSKKCRSAKATTYICHIGRNSSRQGGIRRLWSTRSYLGTGTLAYCRKLDSEFHSHRWRDLESGQTTIAFTPLPQRAVENGAVPVSPPRPRTECRWWATCESWMAT